MDPGQTKHSVRVLIAEDDPTFRAALEEFCRRWEGLDCVGCASTTSEAYEIAERETPDVVLLDVHMPTEGGAVAVSRLRAVSPGSRVLVLSAYDDRATVVQMLRVGAAGYLVKGVGPKQIADAVQRVAGGQAVLSPEITSGVVEELAWQLGRADALVREVSDFDAMRDELMSVLAHELLTPVTVIQGGATALARGNALDEGRMGALLDGIERAGARLQRLVRNIETSARLKHRGLDSRRLVPLARVVQGAMQEVPEAEGHVSVAMADELARTKVVVDEVLASRALALVLENAVQLAPPDVPVEVTARSARREVDVVVRDRGPGVPAELREEIFKPFRQIDASDRRSHPGLGVGLSLARLIMERHGGRVWADDPEGPGSVFVLRFPDPRPPSPNDAGGENYG